MYPSCASSTTRETISSCFFYALELGHHWHGQLKIRYRVSRLALSRVVLLDALGPFQVLFDADILWAGKNRLLKFVAVPSLKTAPPSSSSFCIISRTRKCEEVKKLQLGKPEFEWGTVGGDDTDADVLDEDGTGNEVSDKVVRDKKVRISDSEAKTRSL